MICFKGIVFHKKMEIVDRKPAHTQQRTVEMDELEMNLNKLKDNNNNNSEKEEEVIQEHAAMNAALKTLQDVFGPEQED